jgi:metal-responsive CopG/Arc/MetJ family transcriptional regulator
MRRTQIYLDEEIYAYLKRESRLRKKTISELIREAVKEKIQNRKNKMLSALKEVAGIWKDRDVNPEEFIKTVRKDRRTW